MNIRSLLGVVTCVLALEAFATDSGTPRTLTFEDRVAAQRAIEKVYWRHRIWPKENPDPKPPFSAAMPDETIRAKVGQHVQVSSDWCITHESLQSELDRMASETRDPEKLRELFAALDNDPFLIVEMMVRPVLAKRRSDGNDAWSARSGDVASGLASDLPHEVYDDPIARGIVSTDSEQLGLRARCPATRPTCEREPSHATISVPASPIVPKNEGPTADCAISEVLPLEEEGRYRLPMIADGATCSPDSWTGMQAGPVNRAWHAAVWTGNELIIWGGRGLDNVLLNSGGRYDPATDAWLPTATSGAPAAREIHVAVWTGTEMVIWGGGDSFNGISVGTGARYNAAADSWTPTSLLGAPSPRYLHTGVWTGTQLVVWGGFGGGYLATGGRYDPINDSWTPTTLAGAAFPRAYHSAVWIGSEMIVWGGQFNGDALAGGGRYSPATNTWSSVSTAGAPFPRYYAPAIWTGTRMIVWGGQFGVGNYVRLNTGGRYDPVSDQWESTSMIDAPPPRTHHTLIWTGTEAVLWGGDGPSNPNPIAGWRYDPVTDAWAESSSTDAPSGRIGHQTIWTGDEMMVWGGGGAVLPTPQGSRYCLPGCSAPVAWYRDRDGDGFGDAASPYNACSRPLGFSALSVDCDDGAGDVYPGATQYCDGRNTECNDPAWPAVPLDERDADTDSYRVCAGDCNDSDPSVHPSALDVCNGVDDDCNFLTDEDAYGLDTDGDGAHNACDNCRFAFNPDQLDADGDLIGSACDNCVTTVNPSQQDLDSDQRGDVCDNCAAAYNPFQDDFDVDRRGDACDNCVFDYNPTQTDFDHEGQGDLCDLNDSLIYIYSGDDSYIEWQQETGPTNWNVYEGDLSVLKTSGVYTQVPGSNPLAGKACGVAQVYLEDFESLTPGAVKFALVTGVTGGIEGSLGTNSASATRPNANPCP